MTAPRPEPGALAEEAARLVEAAADWARRAVSAVDPDGDRLDTGAPECAGCPVCRAVRAIRSDHPEAAERMTTLATDAATALAGVLRTMFDGHARPGTPPGPEPHVEHIDLA
ncbi:MAG TPA: hypothetical protein VGO94_15560 [Mycobacteriales bacterium]|nr:hypothetical protein [Cryptosporangiaceae bacterium]MDQ1675203.1 hypothetical protein [Actinomycetota bacterium]HEV7757271.1 hypothetical protein [Mycobacteriales bacterium]